MSKNKNLKKKLSTFEKRFLILQKELYKEIDKEENFTKALNNTLNRKL